MPHLKSACDLTDVGVNTALVSHIFRDIVKWMEGDGLPYNRTNYVNAFIGPDGRMVVELLFFHYDGPPEREIGGGGELNHCKVYLYMDRVSVNFVAENDDSGCGLNFKYITRWVEVDPSMLAFFAKHLSQHLDKIFDTEPRRFSTNDFEVEAVKAVYNITKSVMTGQVIV
jgi:hypothetical protein